MRIPTRVYALFFCFLASLYAAGNPSPAQAQMMDGGAMAGWVMGGEMNMQRQQMREMERIMAPEPKKPEEPLIIWETVTPKILPPDTPIRDADEPVP